MKDTQIQNFEKLLQTLSITGRLIIGTHTSSTHNYMYVVNLSQRPLIVTEQRVLGLEQNFAKQLPILDAINGVEQSLSIVKLPDDG